MTLLLKLEDQGKKVPMLERMPELSPAEWVAFNAFQSLSTARTDQPITPQSVVAWCEMHAFDEVEDRAHLYRLISAMDQVYMEHVRSMLKQKQADARSQHRNKHVSRRAGR